MNSRTLQPLRLLLVLMVTAAISSCANFRRLDADLTQMDVERANIFVNVIAPANANDPTIVVLMADADGENVLAYRVLSMVGEFEWLVPRRETYFFAFSDLNRDLSFQRSEPHGWYRDGSSVDPDIPAGSRLTIVINPADADVASLPAKLVNTPLINFSLMLSVNIGTVTSLENPLFSPKQAEKGLWQPYAFIEDGAAGIFFLESYDPKRIPVFFVHGINGSPKNFEFIIQSLDHSRYQAWVVSYPSGLRLDIIAKGIYQIVNVLQFRHGFDEMHLVAHSMGGLVSRGYVNICAQRGDCSFLSSFTTIATPWYGAASAEMGIKHAPTVVPVWNDLVPDSDYIVPLFDTSMPDGVPYHLLFAFKRDNLIGAENTDGAVTLASELRYDAQLQADLVRGYNESHVGVLSSPAVLEQLELIFAADKPSR